MKNIILTSRAKGFTLIELIVVIVILGVLSAIAAPKFINLQDDAKTAHLQAVKASMESAIDLAHSKLIVDGLEEQVGVFSGAEPKLAQWCDSCLFSWGYPANMPVTWTHLLDDIDFSTDTGNQIVIASGIPGMATSSAFTFNDNVSGGAIIDLACYIRYTPPTTATADYELVLVPCS